MRNPNGYGGISYMGKNRRNPYRVRITTGWEDNEETGIPKQLYATLGYYPTKKAAMIALAEYNKDPYDLDADKITFAEAYNAWAARDLESKGESRKRQLNTAFKKCKPLHNLKLKEIKTKHLQDIIDKYAEQSEESQNIIKAIYKIVFNFGLEHDIVIRDYSAFVKINSSDEESEGIHKPFTMEEIETLWQNLDAPVVVSPGRYDEEIVTPADSVLICIYTGMRPSELLKMPKENIFLDERYMIGGSKTKAGKRRLIPIHEDIVPLIEKRLNEENGLLIPYKGRQAKLDQYRNYMFNPLMEKLGLDHLPHDGRHTFATFAERANIKMLSIKLIMGHTTTDITEKVYTHKDPAELVEDVNKIIFREK